LDTINVFFTRAVYGIIPIWKGVPEQQAKLLLWRKRPNLVRIKTLGTRLATPLKPERRERTVLPFLLFPTVSLVSFHYWLFWYLLIPRKSSFSS
jgi:hypothetical protein